MKYEIKPEYRHLFDEEIRDKKLPLKKPVNEGTYNESWDDLGLTKEALQPVTDFQKGEWLISKNRKVLAKYQEMIRNEHRFISSSTYYIRKTMDKHQGKVDNCNLEAFNRPTEKELHDFLLGMVKARYNEGDRVRCLYDDEIRMINHLLEPSWKIDFVEENEIWIRGLGLLVMKNGKWAEKAGKKLALYRYQKQGGYWVIAKRYYESDEQFKEITGVTENFQRLTNTEFEV